MLRWLYKLDHLYGLLLTFGITLLLEGLFRSFYGVSGQPFSVPDALAGATDLGFMHLPNYRAWVVAASISVCLVTCSAPTCAPARKTQLAERGIGQMALPQLSSALLQFLSHYMGVAAGALYVREQDGSLRRAASYGYGREDEQYGAVLAPGHGLPWQALQQRRLIQLDQLPDDYLKISSGMGAAPPRHLLLAPVDSDGLVNGVLELGFLEPVQPRQLDFIKLVSSNIGTAIEATLARQRIAEVLAETQQLNEELQVQQEELRTANEELEEQSRVLEESQASLENQKLGKGSIFTLTLPAQWAAPAHGAAVLTPTMAPIGFDTLPNRQALAMRLPVYRPDLPVNTVSERRAAYIGSVGIGFSVHRLVSEALAEIPVRNARLTLQDVSEGSPASGGALLYDSADTDGSSTSTERLITCVLPIDFNGRQWQARFTAPMSSLYSRVDVFLPWLALLTGFAGTMLIYALFHTLSSSRLRAIRMAKAMTRELRESQAKLQLSHHKLRRLAAHAEQIKEEERKRIAREIHDDLGQNLLALRIEADVLTTRTSHRHSRLHERARCTLVQIDNTIKSVSSNSDA
eukprot:gene28465-35320_t